MDNDTRIQPLTSNTGAGCTPQTGLLHAKFQQNPDLSQTAICLVTFPKKRSLYMCQMRSRGHDDRSEHDQEDLQVTQAVLCRCVGRGFSCHWAIVT